MANVKYLQGMVTAFTSMLIATVLWFVQSTVIGVGQQVWLQSGIPADSVYNIQSQLQVLVFAMMGFCILIALGGLVYAYRASHETERQDWQDYYV